VNVLTAFYDLQVSPATFDIVNFLFLAEMQRMAQNLDVIDLVIVASENDDGFRADQHQTSIHDKNRILSNVLMKCYTLSPHCRRSLFIRHRDDAALIQSDATHVFPKSYSIDTPYPFYLTKEMVHFGLRGAPYPAFSATEEAIERMKSWIKPRAGDKRPIVITLREMSRHPERNSNIAAWANFAKSLDHRIYFPIFIRDTASIFSPVKLEINDFETCDLAAVNLELRMALYQSAYLNLTVTNGPSLLLNNNPECRFIEFKSSEDAINTTDYYYGKLGFTADYHHLRLNSQQKILRERDNFESISQAFQSMVRDIDSGPPIPAVPWEAPEVWLKRFANFGAFDDVQRIFRFITAKNGAPEAFQQFYQETLLSAARHLFEQELWRDSKAGYDLLIEYVPKNIEIALERLKVFLHLDDAYGFIDELDRLEYLGADLSSLQAIWAQCLCDKGRFLEAVNRYENHLRIAPSDFSVWLNYSKALKNTGNIEGQVKALESALSMVDADDKEVAAIIKTELNTAYKEK
jgi:tetratricopeptide (TPR) repeat protein